MAFVSDTFTETTSVLITSHTGETGATWTDHTSYTASQLAVDAADYARKSVGGSSTGCAYASGVPSSAEYDIAHDLKTGSSLSTASAMGVVARVDTSANTMYIFRWYQPTTKWQLYKIIAGSATLLSESSVDSLSTSTTYSVDIEMYDATKRMLVDAVEKCTTTDNAITAAGRVGIREGTTGNDTNVRIDNLVATDAAGTTVNIPLATLGLTGYSPSITASGNLTVTPPSATINPTAQIPTIAASDHQTVSPPVAALNLTAYTPAITTDGSVTVDVPLANVTLTGYAPSIQTPNNVDIPVAALTVTGYVPTISTTLLIDVPLGTLTLTGLAPVISAGQAATVTPPVATLNLVGYVPEVTGTVSVWTVQSADDTTWTLQSEDSTTWAVQ